MAEIGKTYHNLLKTIINEGVKRPDPNRKDIYRIQIPDAKIRHDFKNGFPAITTKKLYWKGVVGELLWFLRGNTNIKYLIDNNIHIWDKDAYNHYLKAYDYCDLPKLTLDEFIIKVKEGKGTTFSDYSFYGELGRVYGAQWRNWNGPQKALEGLRGVDQISNLIKGLKENPLGSQHIVTAWNPAELDDMALPPCHWSFEILVEPLSTKQRVNLTTEDQRLTAFITARELLDNTLNIPKYQFTLKWHQRSVDSFLGKM